MITKKVTKPRRYKSCVYCQLQPKPGQVVAIKAMVAVWLARYRPKRVCARHRRWFKELYDSASESAKAEFEQALGQHGERCARCLFPDVFGRSCRSIQALREELSRHLRRHVGESSPERMQWAVLVGAAALAMRVEQQLSQEKQVICLDVHQRLLETRQNQLERVINLLAFESGYCFDIHWCDRVRAQLEPFVALSQQTEVDVETWLDTMRCLVLETRA